MLLVGSARLLPAFAATDSRLFLYDEKLDVGAHHLARARQRGLTPTAMPADAGALIHRLDRAWRERPASVTGLTTAAAFFIIAQVACRHGLKLTEKRGDAWTFLSPMDCATADDA